MDRLYDELVIRWRDLPRDTIATLYSPDWDADEVVKMAAALRPGPRVLAKVDAHTVSCKVGGTSYIPLPGRIQQPIAGLMTLQLPLTVRAGEQYRVDVQQHSGLTYSRTRIQRGRSRKDQAATVVEYSLSQRKVLGAFRMTTVVSRGEPLLSPAGGNLAALRYIFQAIPTTDSWHAVFSRYIAQLAEQVKVSASIPSRSRRARTTRESRAAASRATSIAIPARSPKSPSTASAISRGSCWRIAARHIASLQRRRPSANWHCAHAASGCGSRFASRAANAGFAASSSSPAISRSPATDRRASIRLLGVGFRAGLHQCETLLDLAEQRGEFPALGRSRGRTKSPAPCARAAGSAPHTARGPCASAAGGIRGGLPHSRPARRSAAPGAPSRRG